MEVFLDCFFDKEFAELQRSSLLSRAKRRELVDYFTTVIAGCCAGENIDTQTGCRRAVIAALRFHTANKAANGAICLMGKYHNVLYIAAKLCFDWDLRDHGTVARLLEDIFACERTFERLQVGAIFGPTAPHFLAGWKSDFRDREENVRAMVYFLDHATSAGLEFTTGHGVGVAANTRFVDVPMEACGRATPVRVVIQLGTPDLLLILLRFGATLRPDQSSSSAVESVLDRLNEYGRVYPFTLVACLKFMLRVLPTLVLSAEDEERVSGANILKDSFLKRYPFLIEDNLVPSSRCGLKPPELKHLARCVIRYRLSENYQLPYGIQDLHLPEDMKNYLDLQLD